MRNFAASERTSKALPHPTLSACQSFRCLKPQQPHKLLRYVHSKARGFGSVLFCFYLIRTACVLSRRRICPDRNDIFAFGSTIFFPSTWTLPCLINRLTSARDFLMAKPCE